jgi:large subunit ribosomal protein L25
VLLTDAESLVVNISEAIEAAEEEGGEAAAAAEAAPAEASAE